ncbi:glycosyltransferase family 39 protein, partial [Arthrospira platensis SPKY1]|nr:glycosyltransferase family 39 protein [Arthrospira platensis SPKY1]
NGQESIWNDEWFTINEIQQADMASFFKEIIHGENTPPLYYILLRWWSGNGRKLDASYLRFLSAVFAAIAVGLTFRFGRALYGNQIGLIAALLLASSPYLCWYGQEIRSLT